MDTSSFPEAYELERDYAPPVLRMPPALRCAICCSVVAAREHVHFCCPQCAFLVCARPFCVEEWDTSVDAQQMHAQHVCPRQRFGSSRVDLASMFKHEGERRQLLQVVFLHMEAAKYLLRQPDLSRQEFLASLRFDESVQNLANRGIGVMVPTMKKERKHKNMGPTKDVPVSTLGEIVVQSTSGLEINDLGVDVATVAFSALVWQSMSKPDKSPQLVSMYLLIDELVRMKHVMHLHPDMLQELSTTDRARHDALLQRVTSLQFYVDKDDTKEPLRAGIYTGTQTLSQLFDLEYSLAGAAGVPINVAYLITLVYAPDKMDHGEHRNATTKLFVRLMGTTENPHMLVAQAHSSLYSLMHWVMGELQSEETRHGGLSIVANTPEDYDVLEPSAEHPRVLAARIPGAKLTDAPQPVHVETWARSQRKNFLAQKNIFTGAIDNARTISRLAQYVDELTDPATSIEKRHLLYMTLTGVKVPQDDAHAFKVPFTALVVRANAVL